MNTRTRKVRWVRGVAVALAMLGLGIAPVWTELLSPDAIAAPQTMVPGRPPGQLSVVELFTSQSCSSCPPAEALLGELAARPDLIALAFHVDYWNDLNYGAAGRWRDVHSDPAYSARQRLYAQHIPGGVYTPQMVVDGRTQAIGSRAADVTQAIMAARKESALLLSATTTPTGGIELRAEGQADPNMGAAEVWLVRYRTRETTKIRAGENRGQTQVNHHIVTGMTKVGDWVLDTRSLILDTVSLPLDGGCAILVQGIGQGPIVGAAPCPAGLPKAS